MRCFSDVLPGSCRASRRNDCTCIWMWLCVWLCRKWLAAATGRSLHSKQAACLFACNVPAIFFSLFILWLIYMHPTLYWVFVFARWNKRKKVSFLFFRVPVHVPMTLHVHSSLCVWHEASRAEGAECGFMMKFSGNLKSPITKTCRKNRQRWKDGEKQGWREKFNCSIAKLTETTWKHCLSLFVMGKKRHFVYFYLCLWLHGCISVCQSV